MTYFTVYDTGLIDTLTLASSGGRLVGCWFENDRYYGYGVREEMARDDADPVLMQACDWLDRYFSGARPGPAELPLGAGGTPFQQAVWTELARIPYGATTTYGAIAAELAHRNGRPMSSRAVGGAVGRNPLCVIVPCHRVVGASGSLTGFGGGIARKVKLLAHEGVDVSQFSIPTRGTAL